MLSAERREELLRLVRDEGVGEVTELARLIGVSPSTIRRDLTSLETAGALVRVHGGAVLSAAPAAPAGPAEEPVPGDRRQEHPREKDELADAAVRLVAPGSTLLITGGTTSEALVRRLAGVHGLTVVTNSLTIAGLLADHPGTEVVVLGGYLRHGENSLLGHITRLAMAELSVDQAIVSTYGISARGLTGANIAEADTDRFLLESVPRIVVLADGSKFGRSSGIRIVGLDRVSAVVTDALAPEEEVAALRERGVEVVRG
ncbi:DeoR/GlpR family DNA-binding transcription regulator [Streptomyces sp. NPDC012421]|uniref:DeoR/GlpR family DNA-binding transcription regulator n=1 Tax=Streptomyces sp. NPDC012421 TaxID=3364832 RepID=UPI0036DFFB46